MSTTYGFMGDSDSSGEWFSSVVTFFRNAEKATPTIGQNDSSGQWFSSTVYFDSQVGFASILGNFNIFIPSNVLFFGNRIPDFYALTGGYTGATFMKNMFVLNVRGYWDTSLSNPFVGQLFPHAGSAGGPGQVFPF